MSVNAHHLHFSRVVFVKFCVHISRRDVCESRHPIPRVRRVSSEHVVLETVVETLRAKKYYGANAYYNAIVLFYTSVLSVVFVYCLSRNAASSFCNRVIFANGP